MPKHSSLSTSGRPVSMIPWLAARFVSGRVSVWRTRRNGHSVGSRSGTYVQQLRSHHKGEQDRLQVCRPKYQSVCGKGSSFPVAALRTSEDTGTVVVIVEFVFHSICSSQTMGSVQFYCTHTYVHSARCRSGYSELRGDHHQQRANDLSRHSGFGLTLERSRPNRAL